MLPWNGYKLADLFILARASSEMHNEKYYFIKQSWQLLKNGIPFIIFFKVYYYDFVYENNA